jgi:hypothetical protein
MQIWWCIGNWQKTAETKLQRFLLTTNTIKNTIFFAYIGNLSKLSKLSIFDIFDIFDIFGDFYKNVKNKHYFLHKNFQGLLFTDSPPGGTQRVGFLKVTFWYPSKFQKNHFFLKFSFLALIFDVVQACGHSINF